ncbi:MAG: outer membrane lipoprotein-sorting protein [Candidatus Alcyoniella australis]|nr:outer membrane lipoprotein-sorting protein [Candidatus Alcyoniella australis]
MNRSFPAILIVLVLCLGAIQSAVSQDLDVKEIIRRSNDLLRGEKSYSELLMKVETPRWTRNYVMRCWTQGTERALIVISKPEKDNGSAFLKLGRQMWQYVPRVDKVIKIPPSAMLQSWMGSDFTNDDLARADSIVVDYEHMLLGREQVDGADCYKIQSIPHEDAPVVWGKVLSWIDVDSFILRRGEFYDEDGPLVKRMTSVDIRQIQGRWVSMKQVMINLADPGHSTTLIFNNIDFDTPMPAGVFDLNQIKLPR